MKPRLCTFLKPDDLPCRAFAITGSALCHAHKCLLARQRRQYKALSPPAIRIGPLANQLSIQRAIGRILRAIAANSIPLERSSALFQKVLRAMVQRNRAAALAAQIGALPLNLEPRTSNLEPLTSNLVPRTSNLEPCPFALAPARHYNQPNPLDSQLTTCNLQPVTEFESL